MLRSLVHQNQHVLVREAVSVAKEKKIVMNGRGGGEGVHAQTCSTLTEGRRGLTHAGGGEGGEAHLHRVLTADGATGGRGPGQNGRHDIKNTLGTGASQLTMARPLLGCWTRCLTFPVMNPYQQSSVGSGAKGAKGMVLNTCLHLPSSDPVLLNPVNTWTELEVHRTSSTSQGHPKPFVCVCEGGHRNQICEQELDSISCRVYTPLLGETSAPLPILSPHSPESLPNDQRNKTSVLH